MQDLLQAPVSGSDRIQHCWIYGLTDPSTDEIRYVGKAGNPQLRLRQHLHSQGRTRCARWIQGLLSRGLKPGMVLLQEVDQGSWEEAERGWILRMRAEGFRLTNHTDGGEGGQLGAPLSEETKAKISRANAGRVRSLEARARISAAKQGQHLGSDHRAALEAGLNRAWADPEKRVRMLSSRPPLPHPRGEQNHLARLTEADVVVIRERAANGETLISIAGAYGVTKTNISAIARGQTWAHVGGPRTERSATYRIFTDDEVADIRGRFTAGESRLSISRCYGVGHSRIRHMVSDLLQEV